MSIPFYRRRKDTKSKPENVQAWIKCLNNSWSFTLIDGNKENFSLYGNVEDEKVNINRMNLIPLLELMNWIYDPKKKKNLTVYCNSSYVVNCMKEWLDKWKRHDFKIDDNTERPYADILRKIDSMRSSIELTVKLLMVEDTFSERASSLLEKN